MSEHQAVIESYTALLQAWNTRDAAAFAALFTPDGSVVGFDGSQMNGREQIASELAAIFSSHATASYVAKVREVRLLDTQTALLRAVAGMVPPGTRTINPAVNAVQSLVLVLDANRATIALLQNTPTAFHGRPHLALELTTELAAIAAEGRLVDSSVSR